MEDKIIILETFESPFRANIVRSKLESFGIPCFLTDENFILTVRKTPSFREGI